jgi:hypothetical protein
VLIDGISLGKAPFEHEIVVEPGKRRLEGRHHGYEGAEETIEVAAGESRTVTLRMRRTPYVCDPMDQMCLMGCADDEDCVAEFYCEGFGSPNGHPSSSRMATTSVAAASVTPPRPLSMSKEPTSAG